MELRRTFPQLQIWRTFDDRISTPGNRLTKVWRQPTQMITRKLRHFFLTQWNRRMQRRINQELFQSDQPPTIQVDREIGKAELNGKVGQNALCEFAPDLILLCGSPVLKPCVLEKARLGAINVHFGVAPNYRGENTLFWAMARRDYDCLGITIHQATAAIDGGPVVVTALPRLTAADNEASLWAKCVHLAARELPTIVKRIAAGASAPPQQSPGGRYYKFIERSITGTLWEAFCRNFLGRRIPNRDESVRWSDDR